MSVEDKNQSQEQPKQEAIEDIDLRKFAYEQFKKEGWLNPSEAAIDYFIEGYKAALLSQQNPNAEKQVSERIAGYIHEIDSLRGTIRELVEKIKEGKEGSGGKQLYEFVKASEELPKKVKGDFNRVCVRQVSNGYYDSLSIDFLKLHPNLYEWLKPIIIEQGNDKQILLTKIREQEIEIASLKNKVKELQSDYMAVQEEMQSK